MVRYMIRTRLLIHRAAPKEESEVRGSSFAAASALGTKGGFLWRGDCIRYGFSGGEGG